MSGLSVDAGELRERLEVLTFREVSPGVWAWETLRKTWGKVTVDGKSNLFSKVGIGARNAALVVRKQELSLRCGMRWRGRHLFLTAITDRHRAHLDVAAALVELADCRTGAEEDGSGVQFPGILTEKYLKWEQPEPYSVNQITYVLVTPPEIRLQPGGLVAVNGRNYEVQLAHTLDPSKVEYEITRKGDL